MNHLFCRLTLTVDLHKWMPPDPSLNPGQRSVGWADRACTGPINHTPLSHYISRFGSRCVSLPAQRGTESALSRGAVFVLRDLNKYEERSIVRLFGLRVSETSTLQISSAQRSRVILPLADPNPKPAVVF